MGWTRKRTTQKGKERFIAYYRDVKGKIRSAGTFSTEPQADKAWQKADAKVTEGRMGDTSRGKKRLRRYVEDEWLPHHQMEARTRENYTYYLYRHILPWFGKMRMIEVLPSDIREWRTHLQAEGVSPDVIGYCMTVLSAIFTTALGEVIHLHPCRGVKKPTVPKKHRSIVTPEQFSVVYEALPTDAMQLLVETDIETGLRWGELAELRPKDFDFSTRTLTVSRVVVELSPRFHPTGGRFLVKPYPKDQEYRQFRISHQINAKLQAHVRDNRLGDDDLMFPMPELPQEAPLRELADPETLGMTEPNAAGRQYRHGTTSGYSGGKCRCDHCKAATARYRAERRAAGKDNPRKRRRHAVSTDGHIPRWWFRTHVWLPALEEVGLTGVQMRSLRHAHASWLLHGGANLEIVKERLGHSTIVTTQKYLGSLPEADDTAVDAFTSVRYRIK